MSKTHLIRDMDPDHLRARTYCGLDGWRTDGFSRHFETASGTFEADASPADVTCARCRRALDGESNYD